MFKKGLIALLLLGLIFGLLNACTKKENGSEIGIGNTNGNINNGGAYAIQGDWIFYSSFVADSHLSKMKIDGSDVIDLTKTPASYINVIDDWIYFIDQDNKIRKIKTDGTEETTLGNQLVMKESNFVVQNNTIYFVDNDDKLTLHSMDNSGNNTKKIIDKTILKFMVDGEWIYYVYFNKSDNPKFELHKVKTNGQNDVLLVDDAGFELVSDGDWIYYTSYINDGMIYRIKTNGQEKTKFSDESATSLNIADNNLYYSSAVDNSLMVIPLNGDKSTKLIEEPVSKISIVGEWIFVASGSHLGKLFKVKLDGTELQKVNTYLMVTPDPPGTPTISGIGRPNMSTYSVPTIFESAGWIYYSVFENQQSIRKKKMGDEASVEVTSNPSTTLNSIGDWIFFIDLQNNFSLARIKKDGTEYGIILDEPCLELLVKDNWLYFTDMSENAQLFKIKTDGTELTKMSDIPASSLNLSNNRIIYTLPADEGGNGIYQVNIDGTGSKLIADIRVQSFVVYEDYIIYSFIKNYADKNRMSTVRRMNLDGTGDILLIENNAKIFGAKDGWLYFNEETNDAGLKRISIDGKKTEIVMQPGNFDLFHFIGDKIIVFNYSTDKFYIMNPDGSDQQIWIP